MFEVIICAYGPAKTGEPQKLFKKVRYLIIPRVGDTIEYQNGWTFMNVESVYIHEGTTPPEIYGLRIRELDAWEHLKATGDWTEEYPSERK